MTAHAEDDPIARRLARSRIALDDGDLAHLRAACVALDAARRAVSAAACDLRSRHERPWIWAPDAP